MAKVIVGMTISLDGFVADQNGNAGRLYPDLAALRDTAYMKDAIEQTGAVLKGRRTFEMGDPDSYVGNYEFQVPIFVLTHHPPSVAPKQDEHLTFTFVTGGVESAVSQAKAAARDKAVQVVGGVSIAQQLLDAGLVDELHVDIMPVFLGIGLRSLKAPALSTSGSRKSTCSELKQELHKRMHDPVPQTGGWLRSVVQGYFNYYAVPGNLQNLAVFRDRLLGLWWRTLRRRSQQRHLPWTRMLALGRRWFPQLRVLHPYPQCASPPVI